MSDNTNLNFSADNAKDGIFKKILNVLRIIFSPILLILGILPRKLRIILIIIVITALCVSLLFLTRPKAEKRPIPETVVTVETIDAQRTDYPVIVKTNGTIQADTRGNLVSQIRGEIVGVSKNFKPGGAFNAGEVLIEVDDRDYRAEVSQALAAVSQAEAIYKQELAQAKQAKTDWQRLGKLGNPPTLVAREPQLAAAKAEMDSAKARYQTAKLNLQRTKIKAPYSGRVIQRNAVLGQYLSIGSNLAEIFATDGVEVRLPLSQEEYAQLGLENLSDNNKQQFKVEISSQLGSKSFTWDAFITRTDSTFDLTTRQIDVVAEVFSPFSTNGEKPSLKIGQFVNANILGRTIENVIVVPNKALREGRYVFTSKNKKLVQSPVTVLWQDDKNAIIESGLNEGDIVVTTSLNSTLTGASVKFQNQDSKNTITPIDDTAAANKPTAPETAAAATTNAVQPQAAPQP